MFSCRQAFSTLFVIPGGPQLKTPIFCTCNRREPNGSNPQHQLFPGPAPLGPCHLAALGTDAGQAACPSLRRLLGRLSPPHGAAGAMEERWDPQRSLSAVGSGCGRGLAIAGCVWLVWGLSDSCSSSWLQKESGVHAPSALPLVQRPPRSPGPRGQARTTLPQWLVGALLLSPPGH